VLDFFQHVPLEQVAEWPRGAAVVIKPAFQELQGELSGVRLESLDVPDAEAVGLVGKETSKSRFSTSIRASRPG
jgi:hypothetical protein